MKMFRWVEASRKKNMLMRINRRSFLTGSLTWLGIQQQGLDHWVRDVVLVNNFLRRWDARSINKWRMLLTGIFRILNKCHIDVRHPTRMVDGLRFQRQDPHQQFWLLETMIRLVARVEEVKVVYNPDGIYVVPSLRDVRIECITYFEHTWIKYCPRKLSCRY